MKIRRTAMLIAVTMLAIAVDSRLGLSESAGEATRIDQALMGTSQASAPIVSAAVFRSQHTSAMRSHDLTANVSVVPVGHQENDQSEDHYSASGGVEFGSNGTSASFCTASKNTDCDVYCTGGSLCGSNCCQPWWAHKHGMFGELLYLFAGGSDTIYAGEQSGLLPSSSPTGPIGRTEIGGEVGFRTGFSYAISCKSSLVASYARWDGDAFSSIAANGANLLSSTIIHPSTATVGSDSLTANANQAISFQNIDLLYRRMLRASDCGVLNMNSGLRYGQMEQEFTSRQTMSVATGLTTVDTEADFSGFGIISGLDGERRSADTGCFVYGKAMGSLLAGSWRAGYRQTNQFATGVIANRYEDFRVSPVVDTELGLGWRSPGDHLRISAGYLFSSWFNAVNNRDYIQAVRRGNLLELDHSLTFSGLTFRTELRF